LSSISQVILKVTSPGVPDFYRGTELWDLSLADPDNRRPVDFTSREARLRELQEKSSPRGLLKGWQDGSLKMFATWKLLQFRREHADLFLQGAYIPLRVTGARAEHAVAFARHLHDQWCIVAVPRLFASLSRVGSPPVREKVWHDTEIELPDGAPRELVNVLTGERVRSPRLGSDLFRHLPWAVLSGE
jgi:(1->4)-alpha-D-glucan 1-alpha-D-glucosylmutase